VITHNYDTISLASDYVRKINIIMLFIFLQINEDDNNNNNNITTIKLNCQRLDREAGAQTCALQL